MGFGNPLLRFGCWANGEHVWSKKYETWRGWERECRWCMHTERCLPPKRVRRAAALWGSPDLTPEVIAEGRRIAAEHGLLRSVPRGENLEWGDP